MRLTLRVAVLSVCALAVSACGSEHLDAENASLVALGTEIAELEKQLQAIQTETEVEAAPSTTTIFRKVKGSAPADEEQRPLCEEGPRCGQTLVEHWGSRGIRVLAPTHWVGELEDAGGSGSRSQWTNPDDPKELIYAANGVSKGGWYEIDGVESSITPMVSDTADIYQQSRTVFVYVDSKDDIAILGVWRVTQSYDGNDCCYYHAQIRLRYHNPYNADFWNKFLDHQLQVVAGTEIDAEFQHHKLEDMFPSE